MKLNSDVSDHSTVVLKGFGPEKILCDCSCYSAMAKQQSTMLMLFKKANRANATEYTEIKKILSTSEGTWTSGEGVLDDAIPPIQRDENTSNEQQIDICNIASHSKRSKLSAEQEFKF